MFISRIASRVLSPHLRYLRRTLASCVVFVLDAFCCLTPIGSEGSFASRPTDTNSELYTSLRVESGSTSLASCHRAYEKGQDQPYGQRISFGISFRGSRLASGYTTPVAIDFLGLCTDPLVWIRLRVPCACQPEAWISSGLRSRRSRCVVRRSARPFRQSISYTD